MFITARFDIARVPVEMLEYCIDDILFPREIKSKTDMHKANVIAISKLKNQQDKTKIEDLAFLIAQRLAMNSDYDIAKQETKTTISKAAKQVMADCDLVLSKLTDDGICAIKMLMEHIAKNIVRVQGKVIDIKLVENMYLLIDIMLRSGKNEYFSCNKDEDVQEMCTKMRHDTMKNG